MRLNIKQLCCLIFMLLFSVAGQAQCAMCRAALESSNGTIKGEAVNNGIVYLMIFPYLLVGVVGYAVYRLRKKKKEAETEQ
ncbi:hypothetical protein [Flavobacterium sp. NRK1]|uniref:hypothetical protein n=1 Tax=Flavobacterium sp. NRK1 TaxID=2954929 RepID=UPI0020928B0C|nr:hypothetical protein [Flavobacterium sp. NRK1]MCO6148103.1 hypothetical protein [Flavobacterium sp. NRK1]